MTLSAELITEVRQRANFACEYCGVTETDSAGQLTVDHYRPQSRAGTDELINLLYCCYRCNLYKSDYWPTLPEEPLLWNPRLDPRENHLLLLADGTLYPISASGRSRYSDCDSTAPNWLPIGSVKRRRNTRQ